MLYIYWCKSSLALEISVQNSQNEPYNIANQGAKCKHKLNIQMLLNDNSSQLSLDQHPKPIVSLISNCLSDINRETIRNRNGVLTEGVLNPFRFSYSGIEGMIPVLDIIPDDIFTSTGMTTARNYFINAVKYSINAGARVVLLAASTKRLFGDGTELKRMFPETIFTIGDNGTALALLKQIDCVITDLTYESPIVIIGAGFLGETAIGYLEAKGYKKIIVISKHKIKLPGIKYHYCSLDHYIRSAEFEGASLILGCAHNHNIQSRQLAAIMLERLILIDVAVPKAFPLSLFSSLNGEIKRFDGGDFEIKKLKMHFPPQLAGLNFEGEFYGCFTEALLLALSNYKGNCDFFEISERNINTINLLLGNYKDDIVVSMKNFGQSVPGYEDVLTY